MRAYTQTVILSTYCLEAAILGKKSLKYVDDLTTHFQYWSGIISMLVIVSFFVFRACYENPY